jgi:hypothetical protein
MSGLFLLSERQMARIAPFSRWHMACRVSMTGAS